MSGPRLVRANRVVAADYPGLEAYLRNELEYEFSCGLVNLSEVRNLVSSPRLKSFYVQAFTHPESIEVGDSFLDKHTMLADNPQKTFALSLKGWCSIEGSVVEVSEFRPRDLSVMQIQIWSLDPNSLDSFAMAVAVALSYTPTELIQESRISLALGEIFSEWGYFTDEF